MSTPLRERPGVPPQPGHLESLIPEDGGLDLGWCLRTLWSHRLVIMLVAALCGAAGLTMSLLSTPAYQATATIAVSQSKVGEVALNGALSAASFMPLVRNHHSAQGIIEKRGLDKPPYSLTSFTFLDRVLTVSEVRNTNLLTASVILRDAKLAADVVNDVATAAVALSHELSQQEAVRARDIIGVHVKELSARLETAQSQLLTFQRTNQVEVLRGDVEALLDHRRDLPFLLGRLASERGRLASAELELKSRHPTTSLKKSIDSDPAMMESVKQRGQANVLGLELRTESPSPVFELLDQEVATTRANVAALEKERAQLLDANGLGGARRERLNALYQQETTLERLKLDYELAKSAYGGAAAQYENATLQVASRSAELQVIDPAVPPDRPFAPRPMRDTLIWLAAGFVIASLVVLARAAIVKSV